jgi:hypothetical protein
MMHDDFRVVNLDLLVYAFVVGLKQQQSFVAKWATTLLTFVQNEQSQQTLV